MIPDDFKPYNLRNCFPRVSGDDPDALQSALTICSFSPRERG